MNYTGCYVLALTSLKYFMQKNAPMNVSIKLKGILNQSIPVGNTPTFHTITHIMAKATNHERKVV